MSDEPTGLGRFNDQRLVREAAAYIERHKDDVAIMALAYIRELSRRFAETLPPDPTTPYTYSARGVARYQCSWEPLCPDPAVAGSSFCEIHSAEAARLAAERAMRTAR